MNDLPKENTIDENLREYFSKIGQRGGETNKKKGKEYFQWVASHRKKKNKQTISETE